MKNPFKKVYPEVDEFGDERGKGVPLNPAIAALLAHYTMKEKV